MLDVREISFAYRDRLILNGISLSLKAGEFLGFLGPNGSGKSTFLKNLLGFLEPLRGRIVFYGGQGAPETEMAEGEEPEFPGGGTVPDRIERSRRLAFVPQNSKPAAALSVRELMLMGRLPHIRDRWSGYGKADRQKVEEVLGALGIADMAERNILSLSGGELQKVIIGRCLVQEGDILLLDEATSGLDLNHSVEIMELMRKKARGEAKTIVAVLHDLNLASQYCDRIVLLKNGRLRYQGSPAEILTEEVVEDIYGIRAVVKTDEYGRPFVLPRRMEKTADASAGALDPRRSPAEAPRVY
ncbi:MAG: ABC transporter ATP-binding protein [Spirochaetaceae bacterium]|jgi:iron complex transport system ATP-binding protein|nr:ABC transporter ATP-binding protein [Spirochaetaceae bacterium]